MFYYIDAKNQPCPKPVILAIKAIEEHVDNFVIDVDNKTAVENLTRLAQTKGFKITVEEKSEIFSVIFSENSTESTPQKTSVEIEKKAGNYSVFIGKKIIGSGNEILGINLMRMFFYTLTQSDDVPASVLFMNEGVTLPYEDKEIIDHLKSLVEMGTSVLVCGTCLNFYGCTNPLEVGEVSNMYSIQNAMKTADKVVTL